MKRQKTKKLESTKRDGGYREFACDICGSSEAIEVPHVRLYTHGQLIHICKNCGFIYVKMRRSYDKIAEVWSKEMFGRAYTARTPLMLARHTYIAEFIDQSIGLRGRRVCDIGAGEGQFLDIAKREYGAVVFGIEPSAPNCEKMKRLGIDNFQGTLEEYTAAKAFRNNEADIVTLMWTLENATSCNDILMGSRAIVNDGGYMVVATGSRILVPFNKPLHAYLSTNPVDTHPSRFSLNTLTSILAKSGYKVLHVNPYLNDGLTLCVIAKKTGIKKAVKIKKDNYKKVRDHFERWHTDTVFYKKETKR